MSTLTYIFAAIGAVAVLGLLLTAAWVAHVEMRHRKQRRDRARPRASDDCP
jgi:hypothetical protein